jgi:hypothetical protein
MAGSCCAFAVVLLLLIQPLLCVVHCAMDARAMTHAVHAAPSDFFLCHMAEPVDSPALIIPALWPGVLPVLALLVMTHLLLRRLTIIAPPHLIARLWAPPIPPPRPTCAA